MKSEQKTKVKDIECVMMASAQRRCLLIRQGEHKEVKAVIFLRDSGASVPPGLSYLWCATVHSGQSDS